MYEFWIIIVPRILGAGVIVMCCIWGIRSIVRILTAAERVRLLKSFIEYEEYRKHSQETLKTIGLMVAPQLSDQLIVDVARLAEWKPGTGTLEKPFY